MPIDPSGSKLSDASDGTSVLIVGGAPVEKRYQKRTGPPTPATKKISPPRTSPVVAVEQQQQQKQEKNGNYQQSPRTAEREMRLRSGTAAPPMFQQQPTTTPQPPGGGSTQQQQQHPCDKKQYHLVDLDVTILGDCASTIQVDHAPTAGIMNPRKDNNKTEPGNAVVSSTTGEATITSHQEPVKPHHLHKSTTPLQEQQQQQQHQPSFLTFKDQAQSARAPVQGRVAMTRGLEEEVSELQTNNRDLVGAAAAAVAQPYDSKVLVDDNNTSNKNRQRPDPNQEKSVDPNSSVYSFVAPNDGKCGCCIQ